jgi:hypothetical protein
MFVTNYPTLIMKNLFLTASFILCSTFVFAQYRNKDGNRIGITGGVSQTTLLNSNFVTQPGIGFNGGLSVRGNYYNNWSMIYGMQFFQNKFSIETTTSSLQKKESEFTIQGAQIRLLLSYNVVKNHVSFDFGPVIQINDKLKTADSDQNNTITGTNLKAVQLEEISKVNGNLYVGISAGNRRVRAIVHYQYGFTNVLNKLNSQEELVLLNNNTKFKGTLGTISGQILFNL